MLKLDEEKKKLDEMIENNEPYSKILQQSIAVDNLLIEYYNSTMKK